MRGAMATRAAMALTCVLAIQCQTQYQPMELESTHFDGQATHVGAEDCRICHESQGTSFDQSAHGRWLRQHQDQACEACHGPGSVHVDRASEEAPDLLRAIERSNPDLCMNCHRSIRTAFSLPHHHPIPEGKMDCSSCHTIHERTAVTRIRGDEACFSCHQDKRGPFVHEHEAMRMGCQSCHDPHGSVQDQLLVENDRNLCLKCHIQGDFPNMGDMNHRVLLNGTSRCVDCHSQVHGSNFRRHLLGY